MSGTRDILHALRSGPMTNAALQDATCTHGSDIADICAKLIQQGRVRRIDGATGRGSRAVYALVRGVSPKRLKDILAACPMTADGGFLVRHRGDAP